MSLFSFFRFEDSTDKKIKIAANLSFLACFGAAGWIASAMNFSASELKLDVLDFGFVLTSNELAVVFGFLISLLLSYISESRLLGILISMAGTGIILTVFAGTENPIFGFLYSIFSGIHPFAVNMGIFAFLLSLSTEYFEMSRDSLVKHSTDSSMTAIILSKISAYSLLGTAAGYFVVTLLGFLSFDYLYYVLYGLLGLPMIVIGIMSSKQAKAAKALKENVELIVRGKFYNFYILTFCTAALNIIMVFFGTFFLVYKFEMNLGFIGLIFLLHSGLVFFLRRKATELMKSKGEDLTMKIRYAVSLLFFIIILISSAQFVDKDSFMKYVLLGILALYGTTTLFDNAIKSFISYFASPNEQRSNLMIYTRLIQIAKIFIPILSGILWLYLDFYAVFAFGAILSAVCLLVAFKIYAAYNDSGNNPAEEG